MILMNATSNLSLVNIVFDAPAFIYIFEACSKQDHFKAGWNLLIP
jgi:hypothetical protein